MQQSEDLRSLDKLIAGIGGAASATSASPCGLLLEHLQAARRGLLGAMRDEYRGSLRQAKESVACIADKNARMEMQKALRSLLEALPA